MAESDASTTAFVERMPRRPLVWNNHTMAEDIRPGMGQTLLLKRYFWWQLKAGLALGNVRRHLGPLNPRRTRLVARNGKHCLYKSPWPGLG